MKSRFDGDPLDSSDSFFDTAGAVFYWSFTPPAQHVGSPPASSSVEIPSAPALTSEAAESSAAQSGPTSTYSLTSGGITINLLFDAAAMAAPASFRAGIQQAASILTSAISDKITVNIKIDYSSTGGGAAAGADNGMYESYSSVRTDLISNETPGDTTFNALPTGSSIQGQSQVVVWNAQLKLFGLMGANDTTTDDGSATFATDINSSLLVGVALHELTHAMGRVPYGPPYGSSPDIFDLFRFTGAGARLINGGNTAPAAYFSVDGGITKLADYGQNSDPSDFLNSGVQGANDPFNEYYGGGTLQSLTTVDKEQLDALGFHTMTPVTTVIEALGSTSLVQVGSNYFLDSVSTGTGPELKYNGAAVVAGQFSPYTPVAVEQISGGYEVALQNAGTGQFSIWQTDSNGNFRSSNTYSGTSAALETLETSFHQDLNGDGVIGIPTTVVIESSGSTSLMQVGNNYFLYPNSGSSGPEVRYGGAPIVASSQAGTWAPIGAEATAGGYEIAWKVVGADQYAVWNADGNGNYVSTAVATTSGSSFALESIETSFHQDFNGDGVIGMPTPVVIESFGSTSLMQVGNDYFLFPNGGSSGPEVEYAGTPIVASSQTGAWAPIGVEATASGYEIAWKAIGADQYAVWNADNNGSYVSTAVATTSGSSLALESTETSFHQDLNGDGVIGLPATVIESSGSTSLVQAGSNYFLYPNGGSSGPELEYAGTPIVALNQVGSWSPIAAVATASGYEIAWKVIGADQYLVWNADSNGNYVSTAVATTSGSSSALEAIEPSFHQDLNGDGVVGIPTPVVIESLGSTSLMQVGSNFFLFPNGGSSGPEVKYGGTPIVASSQAGAWTPLGAEATSGGYEIAWKVNGADQYAVWDADISGNYLSTAVATTSGASLALESIETSFHQDLNGDGAIGVPAANRPVATSAAQPTSSSVPQMFVVTSAMSDSFVFRGDLGLEAVTNPRNPNTAEFNDYTSALANQSATSWLHEQTVPPSHILQVNEGNDLAGNHDHLKQVADLHAIAVFIH